MEVREIVSYHLNQKDSVLEVSFRTNEDDNASFRVDKVPFEEIDSFGFSFDSDIEEDDFFDESDDFLFDDNYNEDEIISFLNEYYLIFPDRLPEIIMD